MTTNGDKLHLPELYEAPDETVQLAHEQLTKASPAEQPVNRRKRRAKEVGKLVVRRPDTDAYEAAKVFVTDAEGNIDYTRLQINEDGTVLALNSSQSKKHI